MTLPSRIVLTGFMGSGKSTVGRLLAARAGYDFVDLDTLIEQRTGTSVPEIFARDGEPAFRAQEHDALRFALAGERTVIALGGGAPETAANIDLLGACPDTVVVYLAAPFAMLFDRCQEQALDPASTPRPNLINREQAEARFTRREPLYVALGTHTLASTGRSPDETVALILEKLVISR
jgi:shikimate kinase